MFIVWKGWGILAILIPIVFMFIVDLATDVMFGDGFYRESNWTLSLVLILSALSIYLAIFALKVDNLHSARQILLKVA